MRVCLVKATGILIEAQSHVLEGTLLSNAIAAGYHAEDIEEKVVTDAEFQAILEASPDIVAAKALAAQKAAEIASNLPSWQTISDAIDAATTIAGLKVIVKKMARVVYWLAKNKGE